MSCSFKPKAALKFLNSVACFFFLFLIILSSLFIIPVVKENTKVKLALAVPAATPITLVKEIALIPPLVADHTIKILSA